MYEGLTLFNAAPQIYSIPGTPETILIKNV
jgi:hypothetical protein